MVWTLVSYTEIEVQTIDVVVQDIIFDFGKISFMDSSGIGLIMGRYKKLRDKGKIYVASANESIQRILLISGLHKLVGVCQDVNSAIWDIKRKDK